MMFRGSKWTSARILSRIGGRRIKSLELFDTQADDDLLIALSKIGSLTSLDVSSEIISDAGVRALVSNCGLSSLMFRKAPLVTDQSLLEISACTAIKELYLEGTAVTDDGISLIAVLPDLWSLDISRTRVTDFGISQIASDHIDVIQFEETVLTGAGFATWSVKDKASIYAKQSSLTDDGFSVLCKAFSHLWNISIENTNVSNSGLRALSRQSPTMIRINHSKIDKEGLIWLIENTEISYIEADSTQCTVTDAEHYEGFNGRDLEINVTE